MGYVIGALILIFVVVEIIRLIIHALTLLAAALVSVCDGIGHGAAALAGLLATVTPRIAAGFVALGILWTVCWLVSEVWYVLRDSRAEQGWFDQIAPHIGAAMVPGSLKSVAALGVPPRSPAFGQSREHPLTLPIPPSLQRLVDAGTHAARRGTSAPPATAADLGNAAGLAPLPMAPALGGPYRTAKPSAPKEPDKGGKLSSLPVKAQLDQVRDLVDAGARASITIRAIAADPVADRASDQMTGTRVAQQRVQAGPAATDMGWAKSRQRAVCDSEPADLRGRGRVIAERSDGVQVGDGNRQHNLYTHKVVTPKIERLADRLRNADVIAATRRLAADPDNKSARRALVDRLSPGGLRLGGPTSELHITVLRSQTTRSGSWLDGTVLFRDVSNGQIGNGNTQRNEFVYVVTPTASARQMLADNRGLAKALVDCAFPEHGHHDTARLGRELTSALENMPLEPDGRSRSVHYDTPAAGRTLHIQAHDGVSVGERSAITRTDRVAVAPVRGGYSQRAVDRILSAETDRAALAGREPAGAAPATRLEPGISRPSRGIGGISAL